MKAFVIKNKEGRYYAQYPREMQRCSRGYFTLDITDAVMVLTSAEAQFIKDAIEEDCNIDAECEIVPITICEGDLEEENRVLKKALLEIRHSYGCVSEVCVDESKWHISSENAVDKIRSYLREMDFAFDDIEDKLGVDYFIKARKQQAKESERDE